MLKLKKSTGPETLVIERLGVTLTLRPMGTEVMEDARNDPLLIEERDALLEAQGVADGKDLPLHHSGRVMNRAIARSAIIAWEGVVDDETGEDAPVCSEAINGAMDNDHFYRALFDGYIVPGYQLDAEKNG